MEIKITLDRDAESLDEVMMLEQNIRDSIEGEFDIGVISIENSLMDEWVNNVK